jgi:hypothetical protein
MTDEAAWDLSALSRAVRLARTDVETARRATRTPGLAPGAAEQRVLLAALERYAAALAHHGRPMPYRLRDEMAMYRTMFDTPRGL